MIDKPSLFDNPNLANKGTFVESPLPGESVDTCYAFDSTIRHEYDGTQDWDEGKEVQETLPAAQWDAMVHDLNAFNVQTTELLNSIYEEIYCLIHGSTVGYDQAALNAILTGAYTFTNKTISFDSNTLTNVASLDTAQTLTNKTINFNDNTLQNVASLNTAQTLTNKTIDGKDNTIKCTPINISTSQTRNFTKEESLKLSTDNVVVTLGTAPYDGFELVVTCSDSINRGYILFTSMTNTTICVCLQKRVTLTFVYSTSGWALKSGAFLVTYDNDVANAPIKNPNLDPSDPDYRYHPNDWASGFGYGDFTVHYNSGIYGVSYYGIPRWCSVVRVSYMGPARGTAIAMTDDSINPMTYVKCLYDAGWTSSWMRVVTNDETQTLTNKTINFANNTLTGVASTSTAQTLTNKTIDYKDNTLLSTPIEIGTTQTYNATSSAQKVLRITADDIVLTLGSAFTGATLTVVAQTSWDRYGYIKYTSGGKDVILAITSQQEVKFYAFSNSWILEDGRALTVTDNAITYAPAGEELPNDWRNYYGANNISFMYSVASGATYDQPSGAFTVSEIWWYQYQCVATGAIWNAGATVPVQQFTRTCTWGTWQTYWTEVTTNNGTQTLTNKTIDAKDNIIKCTVTQIDVDTSPSYSDCLKEVTYLFGANNVVLNLPNPNSPYDYNGHTITIDCKWNISKGYVLFTDISGVRRCLAVHTNQKLRMKMNGGSWIPELVEPLTTYDDTISDAPYINPSDPSQGRYLPNDWRAFVGAIKTSFFYQIGVAYTTYELPTSDVSVDVEWNTAAHATAVAKGLGSDIIWRKNNPSGIWEASWIEMTGNALTQTLTNKTITYQGNKISNAPKVYPVGTETSATHNFTKDECIRTEAASFILTLGTGAYLGQKVTVYAVYGPAYIKYNTNSSNQVCIAVSGGNAVTFTCVSHTNGYWYADSGSVFGIYDNFYNNRPTGTLPSNWKDFYGVGTYTFGAATTKVTEYDLPEGNLNIQVTWRDVVAASALAESNYYSSGNEALVPTMYIRRYYSSGGSTGWSTGWNKVHTGPDNSVTMTMTFTDNTTATYNVRVK